VKFARLLWPSVIVAVLGLPIAAALQQRVANEHDFEMLAAKPGWAPTFVALGHTTDDEGNHTAQKVLWQGGPLSLLAHDEVRLLIVTYGADLQLSRGEIRVAGTDCVYQTPPGAAIVNAAHLTFVRTPACQRLDGDRRELALTMAFRGKGRIGLATFFVPPAEIEPGWLTLTAPDPADPRAVPVMRGRYADRLAGPGYRRIELLKYAWGVAETPQWIWILVAAALIALFAGTVMAGGAPANGAPVWTSLGVASAGLGLALLYAVLVPPLQAPDEIDHALTFAQLAERPELEEQLAILSRRAHFERIHFQPEERLRPVDVGKPLAIAWGTETFAQAVAGRSLTTWLWWRLLSYVLEPLSAPHVLLLIRLANALLFAVSLGIGTALMLLTSAGRVAAPAAAALCLLLIPTLPFFAMHLSEFALLTSTYIVIAAATAAMFLDGGRVHWLGLPFGLAVAALVAGGRSGLPFGATVAAVLAARVLLGSPGAPEAGARVDRRRSLVFWAGLAVGPLLFTQLSTTAFRDGLWPPDASQVPAWFKSAAEFLRSNPSVLVVAIPIGLAAELAVAWIRRRLPTPGRFTGGVVTATCVIAAGGVIASLAASLFLTYPVLPFLEVSRPESALAYGRQVLRVVVTGFRIGNHDWLISQSFWSGFGWADTLPGTGFVTILVLLTAAALVALLLQVARERNLRRAVWLAALSLGWSVTVVGYAISSYYLHRNLLGRYLVGLFLSILAICATSPALLPRIPRAGRWHLVPRREGILLVLAVLIHGYALGFILLRYF
jgi:hypothetical protein